MIWCSADASLSIATPAPAEKQLPLEQNLYCSLEELFVGASKKVKVARRRLNSDGKTSRIEDAVLSVDVKAGWKAGTKITFRGDGNEGVGLVPCTLWCVVCTSVVWTSRWGDGPLTLL